jgi:hypothetical protein
LGPGLGRHQPTLPGTLITVTCVVDQNRRGLTDPRVVLGVGPDASLAEARAARRRLAKELHPDVHTGRSEAERAESGRRMTEVNLALAELEAAVLDTNRPAPGPSSEPSKRPAGPSERDSDHRYPPAAVIDADTFAVGALPADAFEALFLVAYGLGDILVGDEPYELEVYLSDSPACFCQLHIVPEAGGSLVTIDVSRAEGTELPAAEVVRDLLVAELNGLAAMGRT